MKTGKIKIKAKYFVKIKADSNIAAFEDTKEMVIDNSFLLDYILIV